MTKEKSENLHGTNYITATMSENPSTFDFPDETKKEINFQNEWNFLLPQERLFLNKYQLGIVTKQINHASRRCEERSIRLKHLKASEEIVFWTGEKQKLEKPLKSVPRIDNRSCTKKKHRRWDQTFNLKYLIKSIKRKRRRLFRMFTISSYFDKKGMLFRQVVDVSPQWCIHYERVVMCLYFRKIITYSQAFASGAWSSSSRNNKQKPLVPERKGENPNTQLGGRSHGPAGTAGEAGHASGVERDKPAKPAKIASRAEGAEPARLFAAFPDFFKKIA